MGAYLCIWSLIFILQGVEEEWEQAPAVFATRFRKIMEKARNAAGSTTSTSGTGGSQNTPAQSSTSSATAATSSSGTGLNSNQSYTQKPSGLDDLGCSPPSVHHPSSAQMVPLTVEQRLIFVAVTKADEHRLGELEVQGLDDDCFFQQLRKEYLKRRGLMRRWFSIWAYDHCDFVMVGISFDKPTFPPWLTLSRWKRQQNQKWILSPEVHLYHTTLTRTMNSKEWAGNRLYLLCSSGAAFTIITRAGNVISISSVCANSHALMRKML